MMDINELREKTERNKEEVFQRSKDSCIIKIDIAINKAVEKGKYSVRISADNLEFRIPVEVYGKYFNVTDEVINEVIKHYIAQGFNVKFCNTFGLTVDWSEQ
ncbi:hypothetical protein RP127_000265 [Staphylococcus pseudintermedius]|nr:hypothetical protein [Staphylococcus pseudintermedius]